MYDIYIKLLDQFQRAVALRLVDKVIIQSNIDPSHTPGLLIKFNSNTPDHRIENLKTYLKSKYNLKVSIHRIENYSSIRNQYLTMSRIEMIILFNNENY